MDIHLQEQIDAYHRGAMGANESLAFQEKLNADPSLRAESDFQSEVVSGLQSYRRQELKARLDAIDVAPSWFEFAQQSALMKSFGGLVVASMIGAGVFFYAEREEVSPNAIVLDVTHPKPAPLDMVFELPKVQLKQPGEVAELLTTEKAPSSVNATAQSTRSNIKEVSFKPSFEAPTAESIESEQSMNLAELEAMPEETYAEKDSESIDVETKITKNLIIKYKYYDGKLFLSGDLDEAPYEILEINSASGRRIYLEYLGKFYQVGTTDKLSELPEVTDEATIQELQLFQENK